MMYMVVEHYTSGPAPVYQRAAALGRMLPEGLRYVDSWVVADDRMDRCVQLMTSSEAAARVAVEWSGGTGPTG